MTKDNASKRVTARDLFGRFGKSEKEAAEWQERIREHRRKFTKDAEIRRKRLEAQLRATK